MPKKAARTPVIFIRLHPEDQARLDLKCKAEGRKRPEIIRKALTEYLDRLDAEQQDHREAKLERRLKKMEDRLAGLLARGNIDIGVILDIIYRNMPEERRDELLKTAHKKSVTRLRRKLELEGEGLKELYKSVIAASESEAAATDGG